MIYITGDKHADYRYVLSFCLEFNTSKEDILIVLGDAGINYFLDEKDYKLKNVLSELPITFFCVHGNHEERPENIDTYKTKIFHDGLVYYEEEYPDIIFAKDGEIYDFNGLKTLEQPSEEIKDRVRKTLIENDNKVDVILSHTCPYKYIPTETFMYGIDQSKVDNSTEYFLNEIEENTEYDTWYCGHYHTDKHIDKIRFMFNDIEKFKKIKEKKLIYHNK